MELSQAVVGGLQLTGDSTRILEKCFGPLVEAVFYNILNGDKQRDVTEIGKSQSVDVAVVKQSYYALYTLILEAAKRDLDSGSLSSVLEDKISGNRCSTIVRQFEENKTKLRAYLSSVGYSLPHVVDVDWRMDYCIKNDIVEKINQPNYLITLKTEKSGQPNTDEVQFSCNLEQLQDLVNKLKDAVKCLEKTNQS